MKNSILKTLIVFSVLSSTAQAKTILECTTPGDALDSVKVIEEKEGKAILRITYLSDTSESFELGGSLKNLKKGESDTLVAAKDFSNVFGGGIADAALIRVLPGQKKARLAANSKVYYLECHRPL